MLDPSDWKPTKGRERRQDRRRGLREAVVDRSGGVCEWTGCEAAGEHMAHIQGIGRGGDPLGLRDKLRNVAFLCVYHHDLLDGRTERFRLREIEQLLTELIELRAAYNRE